MNKLSLYWVYWSQAIFQQMVLKTQSNIWTTWSRRGKEEDPPFKRKRSNMSKQNLLCHKTSSLLESNKLFFFFLQTKVVSSVLARVTTDQRCWIIKGHFMTLCLYWLRVYVSMFVCPKSRRKIFKLGFDTHRHRPSKRKGLRLLSWVAM